MRKMLVTTALAYANGPLHLGHLVEHIQADIWVRFHRLQGQDCLFISGDDAHGTPIMINAQRNKVQPEELIDQIYQAHLSDLKGFHISFDHYYTTHSLEAKELADQIYERLSANGDILPKMVKQAYDPIEKIFLPDRYVKGKCPRCKAENQYGDNCEVCGATYFPSDLIDPISTLSGVVPTVKESLHYFFRLDNYQMMLKDWLHQGHVQPQIQKKLLEWFEEGLMPWDISRDAPYFGFKIPQTEDKYFYVWFDAPIGYMATFQNLCTLQENLSFDEYWSVDSKVELYHFVGKDIIYFHSLFWPAILSSAGFRLPNKIYTHGFLTINGQKMSKSRGTFITAQQYLSHFNPEYLRYYFAGKLSNGIDDIDFNFEDFCNRINADLVGKVINIASRCSHFINKFFNDQLSTQLENPSLFESFVSAGDKIASLYHEQDFNQAVREIMLLADIANQYINEMKPWVLAKETNKLEETQAICTQALNFFRLIVLYLKPILPETARLSEKFLNIPALSWHSRQEALLGHRILKFTPLLQRIEKEHLTKLLSSDQS